MAQLLEELDKFIPMRVIRFFVVLLLFVQCNEKPSQIKIQNDKVINAKDTTNWVGNYSGTVPSKTSIGMDMKLSLNPSSTYKLFITFLEKNPKKNKKVEYTGQIEWEKDSMTIVLNELDSISNKFRVRKNFVEYLNPDGTPNTGELAEFYILKRENK